MSFISTDQFFSIRIERDFYRVKFYESLDVLSTTISHSKKIGKKRNIEYNGLLLKIKKLSFRGLYHGQLYCPRDMEYKT